MKPVLVILAAGMGSRYGGLKQIDRIGEGGETPSSTTGTDGSDEHDQ